jgi:hypothetical protein
LVSIPWACFFKRSGMAQALVPYKGQFNINHKACG